MSKYNDVLANTMFQTQIADLLPATLNPATVVTSSMLPGTANNIIQVDFTTENQLAVGSKVILRLPPWSYHFSDVNRHYIQTESPQCKGLKGLPTTLICEYNFQTFELVISNFIMTNPIAKDTAISFTVNSFRNPYSARPRADFLVRTADINGYTIDQSFNLTLPFSGSWGPMKTGTVTREDTVTTVGEISNVKMNFELDFPAAFPCRIRVLYPSDMTQYFAPNYVINVDSRGLVFSNLTATIPLAQSTSGIGQLIMTSTNCGYDLSNPANYGNQIPVFFNSWVFQMINKGWVKDTLSFQLVIEELYNSVYYPVALKSSGIIFPKASFTPGAVQSITVTGVDSTTAGQNTKFNVIIKPTHLIPQSSRLIIRFPTAMCMVTGPCLLSSVSGGISTTPDGCLVDGTTLTIYNPFGPSGSFARGGSDLQFVFSTGGRYPGSDILTGGLIGVETYAVEGGLAYIIDKLTPNSLTADQIAQQSALQLKALTAKECSTTSNKFCGSNGLFNPLFKFHFSEGSISLFHNSLYITQDDYRVELLNPTTNTQCSIPASASVTPNQNSLLAIFQIGNNRNDFDENTNEDRFFAYDNSISAKEPFIGSLFSFERCTYVFNMAYDIYNNKKLYTVKKYTVSIEHEDDVMRKRTGLKLDSAYQRDYTSNFLGFEDFPCQTPLDGIYFHPGLPGVLYFQDNRGNLQIKADLDLQETLTQTYDFCNEQLFVSPHRMGHYQLDLKTLIRSNLGFQVYGFGTDPLVFLNKALYVVAYGINRSKYPTDNTLKQTMIVKVDLSLTSVTQITATFTSVTEMWGYIDQITALEMQGFMFTTTNGTTGYYFLKLSPPLYASVASGPSIQQTDSKWKLIQARQDNHMHRPVFGVKELEKSKMYRITTVITPVLDDTDYLTNFYDFGIQLNRFFGLTVLPGACTCGLVNGFQNIKGILLDLRKMKVDRCVDIPMLGCGDSRKLSSNNEQCDDGNLMDGDGCSKDCKIENLWQCSTAEGERSRCQRITCGNGLLDAGEECDDGNFFSGDGCGSTCIEEKGYKCYTAGQACTPMCGDNLIYRQYKKDASGSFYLYYQEKCDNAGSLGCSSVCEPNLGWTCTTDTTLWVSTCVQTCGNNKHETDEVCDDGNNVSGDGCAAGCKFIEPPYVCPLVGKCNAKCGNGFYEGDIPSLGIVATQNEECDDGNQISGDGCSSICTIESGWVCDHRANDGLLLELPSFRSYCRPADVGTSSGASAVQSFYKIATIDEYQWNAYTARGSNAGKFRLIEYEGTSNDGSALRLQGITFVQRRYWWYPYASELTVVKQWQNGVFTTSIDYQQLSTSTGQSIQRGAFGEYFVRTDGLTSLGFYSLVEDTSSVLFKKFYSTEQLGNQQFMGGHEIYYWPKFKMIMARLGDGYTLKCYRFTPNVQQVALNKAQFYSEEWIEDAFRKNLELPGEIKIEPVFFDDYMAAYTLLTGELYPMLRIYRLFEAIEYLEFKESISFNTASTSYLGYSLVYFDAHGSLLFKEHNSPSFNQVPVPVSGGNYGLFTIASNTYIPKAAEASLVFIQRRHDPMSLEEESRDVWGYFDNTAVYKFEATPGSNVLQITQKIDLPTIGVYISTSRMIDVGKYYLAVYSAANCETVIGRTIITSGAAWFYHFETSQWSCINVPYYYWLQNESLAWIVNNA